MRSITWCSPPPGSRRLDTSTCCCTPRAPRSAWSTRRGRRPTRAPISRELVRDLLDRAHGYLLPFDVLRRSLDNRDPRGRGPQHGDPTGGLGYGPIDQPYGLELPPDRVELALRRLAPLAERMSGDVKLGGDE